MLGNAQLLDFQLMFFSQEGEAINLPSIRVEDDNVSLNDFFVLVSLLSVLSCFSHLQLDSKRKIYGGKGDKAHLGGLSLQYDHDLGLNGFDFQVNSY